MNHTSIQRQFKTDVPKDGVFSHIQFNIYTGDLPPPIAPVQKMTYAEDITIKSSHTSAEKEIK